ncbi:MAG: PA14 domain-containing protein, partial [Opitutales bacterium]
MNDGRTGSSLHFSGDLEPWQGILLAVAAAALAWWLYRLETRKGTAAPLNKLLPLLRAVAVALIVLTLTGPTIRNVEEEGQRGRVLVFLDASQSMSIKDDHISAGRKLLLAERHGWLPKDQNLLDPALQDAADLLSEARINLSEGLEDPTANLKELGQNFANTAKKAADLLDGKSYEVPANIDRKGVLHHETWNSIGGNSVNDLRQHARFREGKPDSTGFLTAAESPVNVGDNFGRRIYAKLVPPETGEYRFWIYSDDECALYLNNAGENPDNAREILRSTSYGKRSWSEDRRSRPITLSQGKAYYFEILHKEGGSE